MYESLEDKSIKCKFCDFEGEFEYRWSEEAFLVVCPSCEKVNYEVSRDKIDALVQDIIKDSLERLRKSEDT